MEKVIQFDWTRKLKKQRKYFNTFFLTRNVSIFHSRLFSTPPQSYHTCKFILWFWANLGIPEHSWSQPTERVVLLSLFLRCLSTRTNSQDWIFLSVDIDKVLHVSDRCCTKFNIYCFILYIFSVINDSIFKLMMLIESGILLKNHVSYKLC